MQFLFFYLINALSHKSTCQLQLAIQTYSILNLDRTVFGIYEILICESSSVVLNTSHVPVILNHEYSTGIPRELKKTRVERKIGFVIKNIGLLGFSPSHFCLVDRFCICICIDRVISNLAGNFPAMNFRGKKHI